MVLNLPILHNLYFVLEAFNLPSPTTIWILWNQIAQMILNHFSQVSVYKISLKKEMI